MRLSVCRSFLSMAVLALATTAACGGTAPVGEDDDRTAQGLLADDGPPPPTKPVKPPPVEAPPPNCPPGQFPPSMTSNYRCETVAGACTWIYPSSCYLQMNEYSPTGVITTAVALGAHTTYALGTSGSDSRAAVYGWGLNAHYELGNGTTTNVTRSPIAVLWISGNPVTAIAAGDEDGCALMSDKSVRCWGTIATIPSLLVNQTPAPIAFPSGTTVSQIAHGQNHACAVANGGTEVFCWGNNDKGQLGDGASSAGRLAPFKVPLALAGATVIGLAAGGRSTCALESTGAATCWGDNERGALGNSFAVLACPNSPFPCANPQPGSAGSYNATPQHVVAPTDAYGDLLTFARSATIGGYPTLVGGGAGTFCAQTPANGWYCWGANDQGQAGIQLKGFNTTIDQYAPMVTMPGVNEAPFIAVGMNHSCVGGGSSPLHCFGANEDGQLGNDSTSTTPTFALQSAETFQLWESSAPNFSTFAVGANHSCGVLPANTPQEDGTSNFACWGSDDSGQVSTQGSTMYSGSNGWTLASLLAPMYMDWSFYN